MKSDLQSYLPRSISLAEAPLLVEAVATGIQRTATIDLAPWPVLEKRGSVVVSTPVSALGALLQEGKAPGGALLVWSAAARSLLGELERAGNDIRLVLAPRDGGRLAVGGVTAGTEARSRSLDVPADGVALWWIAVAGMLINGDDAARGLAARLTQKGDESDGALFDALDLASRMQELFGLSDWKGEQTPKIPLEARLAMTLESIDRLQAVIGVQAEELAQFMTADAASARELDRLRETLAQKAQMQEELLALQASLSETQYAQGLRETVLGGLLLDDITEQRRLAHLVRDYEEWSHALQADVATLRDELDRVYGSKSWKLTSPLRSLRQKNPAD